MTTATKAEWIFDEYMGVRLKLQRAGEQIDALQAEMIGVLNTEPYPYMPRAHFDKQSQNLIVSVHVQKLPEPMWGIKVGEIVHNLRSCLDHIVWQLVVHKHGRPPVTKMNQFPIFETEAGFDDRGVKKFLHDVGSDAIDLIRSEQPFKTRQDTIKMPLWNLKELSDVDKHRRLHLTGAMVSAFDVKFAPLKFPVKIAVIEQRDTGPIQADAVLWRGFVHGATEWPFANRDVHFKLTVDIAFDQGTPAVGGWIVVGTLDECATRVREIADRIGTEIFKIKL